MALKPTAPRLPADLLARFGEPEAIFGPNLRFRAASAALGIALVALGLGFVVARVAWGAARVPLGEFLGGGLLALGAAAILLPLRVPRNWVFVCPRGLVRTRGADWDVVDWAMVLRFEDASRTRGALLARQCRLVITGGAEWGFQADWVADYHRLTEVLRLKVEQRRLPPVADGPDS
jgi:hypothetical protein